MESWMISLAIVIAGLIASFAIMKYIVNKMLKENEKRDERLSNLEKFMNEKTPILTHLSKSEDEIKVKANDQGNKIVELKERISQAPTMTEVRSEFVTKEMFRQVEKHIDTRFDSFEKKFDGIDTDLKEILSAVKGK